MQKVPRPLSLFISFALLAACGDGGSSTVKDSGTPDADSGICGTHSNPGVLTLTDLLPATGSTVVNQSIVHGFTIVNAPAEFSGFKIIREDAHTAGVSTPFDLAFQTTKSGNNIFYRLVVDAWTFAPGHVELRAAGSFDTKNGCTWVFPTPLYSYNVSPGPTPDGGFAAETGKDGPAKPIDTSFDLSPTIDAPDVIDVPIALDTEPDRPAVLDGLAPIELDAGVDGSSLDASLD